MSALPAQFVERLRQIIPDSQWQPVWDSFQHPKPLVTRVNTTLISVEEVMQLLRNESITGSQVSWKPDALVFTAEQRSRVLDSAAYRQGLLYSQNLSSQLAPLVLDPQLGEEILDMCAAPGGKTAQIACMMRGTGRLAAVEKVKTRFYKLKDVLRSQHHHGVHTYLTDGCRLWHKTPERFDRILLDAPCSSESRFQLHDPGSYQHWKLRKIKETARKQKQLLYSAVHCLKPGGIVVYSTCAFAPEENEAVIDHALKQFSGQLQVLPARVPVANTQPGLTRWQNKEFDASLANSIRILPDEVMDGFYMCKLTKTASTVVTDH
jgi:16S rRNA (cytosine1407-C5)-methyltransferase